MAKKSTRFNPDKQTVKKTFETLARNSVQKPKRRLRKPLNKDQVAAFDQHVEARPYESKNVIDDKKKMEERMVGAIKKRKMRIRNGQVSNGKAVMRPVTALLRELVKTDEATLYRAVLDEQLRVLEANGEQNAAEYLKTRKRRKNEGTELEVIRRIKEQIKANLKRFRQADKGEVTESEDEIEEEEVKEVVVEKVLPADDHKEGEVGAKRIAPEELVEEEEEEAMETDDHGSDDLEQSAEAAAVVQNLPVQERTHKKEIPNSGSTTTTTSSSSSATQTASSTSLLQTLQVVDPQLNDNEEEQEEEDDDEPWSQSTLSLDEEDNNSDESGDENDPHADICEDSDLSEAITTLAQNASENRIQDPPSVVSPEKQTNNGYADDVASNKDVIHEEVVEIQASERPVCAEGAHKKGVHAMESEENVAAEEDEANGQGENGISSNKVSIATSKLPKTVDPDELIRQIKNYLAPLTVNLQRNLTCIFKHFERNAVISVVYHHILKKKAENAEKKKKGQKATTKLPESREIFRMATSPALPGVGTLLHNGVPTADCPFALPIYGPPGSRDSFHPSKIAYLKEDRVVKPSTTYDPDLKISCKCNGVCDSDCSCVKASVQHGHAFISGEKVIRFKDDFYETTLICCGPLCSCSSSCGNRLPRQEAREGVVISHVPGMDFVVKTLTPINTGDIVLQFTGDVTCLETKEEDQQFSQKAKKEDPETNLERYSWATQDETYLPFVAAVLANRIDKKDKEVKETSERQHDEEVEEPSESQWDEEVEEPFERQQDGEGAEPSERVGSSDQNKVKEISFPYKTIMDVRFCGNVGRYMSTAEQPNVLPIRVIENDLNPDAIRLLFVACRTIRPHDQVLADYGGDYHFIEKCACGTPPCGESRQTLENMGHIKAYNFLMEINDKNRGAIPHDPFVSNLSQNGREMLQRKLQLLYEVYKDPLPLKKAQPQKKSHPQKRNQPLKKRQPLKKW